MDIQSSRMMKLIRNAVAIGFLGIALNTTAQVTLFSDNLENGATGWTVNGSSDALNNNNDGGLWHLTQRWSASTNTAWYYGQESTGSVGTNWWNEGWITTPAIQVTGVTNAILTYAHRTGGDICLPWDDDYVAVLISTNDFATASLPVEGLPNGSYLWGGAGSYEGPTITVDISEYVGQTIKVRFYCSFQHWCHEHYENPWDCTPTEGYYIDDVSVVGNVVIPCQ